MSWAGAMGDCGTMYKGSGFVLLCSDDTSERAGGVTSACLI